MTEIAGITIGSFDQDGRQIVSSEPRVGNEFMAVSFNLADSTTWYQNSTSVTSGSLTPIVSGVSYKIPHENIIDPVHGKLYREDDFASTCKLTIRVDDVEQTEDNPFLFNTSGSYTCNYASGVVTFDPAIPTSSVVTADYSYATNSEWTVSPASGTEIDITYAEAQFSSDLILTDSLQFIIYGYSDVFAPQLGFPSGTQIPILTVTYKTVDNIIDEARGVHPVLKAFGGSLRGVSKDRYIFPFDYKAVKRLEHSKGMYMVVKTQNGLELGGDYCTVTFYGHAVSDS